MTAVRPGAAAELLAAEVHGLLRDLLSLVQRIARGGLRRRVVVWHGHSDPCFWT